MSAEEHRPDVNPSGVEEIAGGTSNRSIPTGSVTSVGLAPGPVAHVFVAARDGRCVCGHDRFTGVHVAHDGTAVPDLGGIVEALQAVSDACQHAIDRVLAVGK